MGSGVGCVAGQSHHGASHYAFCILCTEFKNMLADACVLHHFNHIFMQHCIKNMLHDATKQAGLDGLLADNDMACRLGRTKCSSGDSSVPTMDWWRVQAHNKLHSKMTNMYTAGKRL